MSRKQKITAKSLFCLTFKNIYGLLVSYCNNFIYFAGKNPQNALIHWCTTGLSRVLVDRQVNESGPGISVLPGAHGTSKGSTDPFLLSEGAQGGECIVCSSILSLSPISHL